MTRADFALVSLGLLASTATLLVRMDAGTRFGAIAALAAAVTAGIAANHSIARAPRLIVEYRNQALDGRPEVWAGSSGNGARAALHVVARNEGRGTAEAFEIRFDTAGASYLWNESGNGSSDVEQNYHPPRFLGRDRVINPGEEVCLAMLTWQGKEPGDATARWWATAKSMKRQEGVVRIRAIAPPEYA